MSYQAALWLHAHLWVWMVGGAAALVLVIGLLMWIGFSRSSGGGGGVVRQEDYQASMAARQIDSIYRQASELVDREARRYRDGSR
jgi:hypothetical protein